MNNIDWKKADKLHIFLFIMMVVGSFTLLFFVDTSLIFRMEYVEKNYWFVNNLEVFMF